MVHKTPNNSGIKWSEHPGRFERHLQRRLGNPLFPSDRQNISIAELNEAVEKDKKEQNKFWTWFRVFIKTFQETNDARSNLEESWKLAQEITSWIPYAAGIGGLAGSKVKDLNKILEDLLNYMDVSFPQSRKLNDQLRNLMVLDSMPMLAGTKLPDNPIAENEQAAAILCENLQSISIAGECSRQFGKDFRPSESELLELVKRGQSLEWFNKEEAKEISDALRG